MYVSREWLMENRTPRGGWTKAQFKVLGIKYPPRNGWIGTVVGRQITDEQVKAFVDCRSKFTNSTVRNMAKAIRRGYMDPGEMDRLYGREPTPRLDSDEIKAVAELRQIVGAPD